MNKRQFQMLPTDEWTPVPNKTNHMPTTIVVIQSEFYTKTIYIFGYL